MNYNSDEDQFSHLILTRLEKAAGKWEFDLLSSFLETSLVSLQSIFTLVELDMHVGFELI